MKPNLTSRHHSRPPSPNMASGVDFPSIRTYRPLYRLKYGCNPHQTPSAILEVIDPAAAETTDPTNQQPQPFRVINGTPGYINLLDALNAWQLVKELKMALQLPAAASFKHVSPAGAAVAIPLTEKEQEVYDVTQQQMSPAALAYLRARQADPMCSFGDFAALSEPVDEQTALYLKGIVSDGIIAPGYDSKALEILKAKKNGAYIVLQADMDYVPPPIEIREVYGAVFAQMRNNYQFTQENLKHVVTQNKHLPEQAVIDLIVATIALKYTQSNSVAYALNGQVIGVGAGQQSRVDCVKLAGSKVAKWYLRQHPKVRALPFKDSIKKQDRVNARVGYIEGHMTKPEEEAFLALLTSTPEPLTEVEKEEFLATLKGVSLSSDAFFPFRDNIDQAAKYGVQYVAQPGGSVQDQAVTAAADQYKMVMAYTGVRLFHH